MPAAGVLRARGDAASIAQWMSVLQEALTRQKLGVSPQIKKAMGAWLVPESNDSSDSFSEPESDTEWERQRAEQSDDDDEFDEEEASYSDIDEEALRTPINKRPAPSAPVLEKAKAAALRRRRSLASSTDSRDSDASSRSRRRSTMDSESSVNRRRSNTVDSRASRRATVETFIRRASMTPPPRPPTDLKPRIQVATAVASTHLLVLLFVYAVKK